MKKAALLIFVLIFALCLNGCSAKSTSQWKDGTYKAKGDRWQFGNENATIVISKGKITDVTLRKFTPEEQEVNYDEWTGQEVNGKVRPNLKKYKEDLANAIIEKQSADINDIAGATVSSKNWRLAVKRALEQARTKGQ